MISYKKNFKINSNFILLLSMVYVTVSLSADVVAFKLTNFFGFIESGATILFPLTYVIGDVVCEVYGWTTAMKLVWFGLLCEFLFATLITGVIHLKSYGVGLHQAEYINVLGNMWVFVAGGIVSNLVAGLLNVYLISKLKIFMDGRSFWLRSIFSTCISELILVVMTGSIAFLPFLSSKITGKILIDAYILEIIYALIFVFPAQWLADKLKRFEQLDVYDNDQNYNPFKFT